MWIGDVCVCLYEHYIATSMKLKLFEDINKPNSALKDNPFAHKESVFICNIQGRPSPTRMFDWQWKNTMETLF